MSRKTPYKMITDARKNSSGRYCLADLGINPSGFFRTDYGKEAAKLGVVENIEGKLYASESIAVAFAVYRNPLNAKFLTVGDDI